MLEDNTSVDVLLQQLDSADDDARLRERAARALIEAGRPGEAVALLRARLAHFNAHEPGVLPCLCRRCLDDDDEQTATAYGTDFTRDFTVAEGRVLFFWRPADLDAQAARVRRSVNVGLRARLRGAAR